MNHYIAITLLLAFSFPAHAADIDLAASKITIDVEKSGLFSAFAHNHTIGAPLASGQECPTHTITSDQLRASAIQVATSRDRVKQR